MQRKMLRLCVCVYELLLFSSIRDSYTLIMQRGSAVASTSSYFHQQLMKPYDTQHIKQAAGFTLSRPAGECNIKHGHGNSASRSLSRLYVQCPVMHISLTVCLYALCIGAHSCRASKFMQLGRGSNFCILRCFDQNASLECVSQLNNHNKHTPSRTEHSRSEREKLFRGRRVAGGVSECKATERVRVWLRHEI